MKVYFKIKTLYFLIQSSLNKITTLKPLYLFIFVTFRPNATYIMKVLSLFFLGILILSSISLMGKEVNVYSFRQEFLMRPFLKTFEKQTGIKVNVVYAKKGMLERLKLEGRNTKADLILTVDVARLTSLANADLLQTYKSELIDRNIPDSYRDSKGLWTGLTARGRVIFYSKDRVKINELSSYEALADPKWKGKICMRKGTHNYNIALTSSIIAVWGEEFALRWAKSLKSNLARKPQGNDRAQVKSIAEGVCDLAIGNTYYMGQMFENKEQMAWAESARIFFPNQKNRGSHINISGGAITKYAKNRKNALALLEFLTKKESQKMYAAVNHEYPLKSGVVFSEIVKSFGKNQEEIKQNGIKWDTTNLEVIGNLRVKALKIMNLAGFR